VTFDWQETFLTISLQHWFLEIYNINLLTLFLGEMINSQGLLQNNKHNTFYVSRQIIFASKPAQMILIKINLKLRLDKYLTHISAENVKTNEWRCRWTNWNCTENNFLNVVFLTTDGKEVRCLLYMQLSRPKINSVGLCS